MYKAKLDVYECGIEPSPQPVVGGGQMPVAYCSPRPRCGWLTLLNSFRLRCG